MLFLTRLLMKSVALSSPTIVVITDRTDLDDQLSGLFTGAKGYIGDESVISVESRVRTAGLLKGTLQRRCVSHHDSQIHRRCRTADASGPTSSASLMRLTVAK